MATAGDQRESAGPALRAPTGFSRVKLSRHACAIRDPRCSQLVVRMSCIHLQVHATPRLRSRMPRASLSALTHALQNLRAQRPGELPDIRDQHGRPLDGGEVASDVVFLPEGDVVRDVALGPPPRDVQDICHDQQDTNHIPETNERIPWGKMEAPTATSGEIAVLRAVPNSFWPWRGIHLYSSMWPGVPLMMYGCESQFNDASISRRGVLPWQT